MRKYILALHAGHNASVCIGDEAGIQYAVQEERLVREKNYWGFPRHALRACLDHAGAAVDDILTVVYGGHQVVSRYHSRQDVLEAYRRQATLTGRVRQRIAMPLVMALQPDYGQDALRNDLAEAGFGAVPVLHYDHHRSHAAAAYYGLRADPQEPYLVLTCDGSGDGLCATVRVMGDGKEEVVATTPWANSLGALYSWVTFAQGFVPLEHEYKLMGMAPYAPAHVAAEMAGLFRSFLWLDEQGLRFQREGSRRISDLGATLYARLQGKRFDYICAGLQQFTEDLLCAWVANAVETTGVRKVLGAGGVFMNVKANQQIAALPEVESFEAFPSCGDETLPFGAFYLEAARRYGDANVSSLEHLYLGDDLCEATVAEAVKTSGFRYDQPDDIAAAISEVLAAGHPVARCAGRMEFGARALCNRSILADPKNPDVVRIINRMVKKRDFWMPFAPVIKEERQHDYIHNPKRLRSPYMMMTFDTRGEATNALMAAVHNADLTCRAQLLRREQNPEMYAILEAFETQTGRGVLLNTSFNLHGYPIVRTPEDAFHVLTHSGLNYLQLGPWLIRKNETD